MEYAGLGGREIGKLKKAKVEVFDVEEVENNVITYTGDTTAGGIMNGKEGGTVLDEAFTSDLVLCELTYLESGEEKSQVLAEERKHMHIDSLDAVFRSHGWDTGVNPEQKVRSCG